MNRSKKWLYHYVNSQLAETIIYVFTDIPFPDTYSLYFFIKNGLKLFKDKPLKPVICLYESISENSSIFL